MCTCKHKFMSFLFLSFKSGEKRLQKYIYITFYIYLCSYILLLLLIFSCGFNLLSGVLSFQSERFTLFFLYGRNFLYSRLASNKCSWFLSGIVLILPSSWRTVLLDTEILGKNSFLSALWIIKESRPTASGLHRFWWPISYRSYWGSWYMMSCFSLAAAQGIPFCLLRVGLWGI